MIYKYNLILALPTSGGTHVNWAEVKKITDDVEKVEDGIKKNTDQGELETLEIYPSDLADGIDDEWLTCFERLKTADTSRLVLFAHGNDVRVANRTGVQMAQLLTDRFGLRKVTRISILSCCAGGEMPIVPGAKCFAQEVHEFLGRKKGVYAQVNARTAEVNSEADGRRVVWVPNVPGAGPETKNGAYKHQPPGSKLLWYWECGEQKVIPVVYTQKV